jgi:GR25 family glycosyltransferase involved in LPS biosynthesis
MYIGTKNLIYIKKNNTYKFISNKNTDNIIDNYIIINNYSSLLYFLIKIKNINKIYFEAKKKKILLKNKSKIYISKNNISFFALYTPQFLKNSSLKIKFVFINDILDSFKTNKERIKYLIDTNNQQYIYNFFNPINNINFIIDYSKINYINKILWINLDNSIYRKTNIENILKNIQIPNKRISAIDGSKLISPILNFERNISNYEIACLLSHIKAITSLKNIEGDYFLICEDDFMLNNTIFFSKDLKQIIKNCPTFDILSIQSTFNKKFYNEYNKWSDYYIENPLTFIGCTGSYIISKSGVDKITSKNTFIDDNNYTLNYPVNVADIYLYKYVDTFVYKYNFISSFNNESIFNKKFIKQYQKFNFKQLNKMLGDIDLL